MKQQNQVTTPHRPTQGYEELEEQNLESVTGGSGGWRPGWWYVLDFWNQLNQPLDEESETSGGEHGADHA